MSLLVFIVIPNQLSQRNLTVILNIMVINKGSVGTILMGYALS